MNTDTVGRIKSCLIAGTMLLVSCSGSSDNPDSPPDDFSQGEVPTAPGSLSGVVYTDSEIELFWEPATDDVTVVEYQIFRDDTLVDSRDGLSFYQDSLTPDTTYVYSVLAIDSDGQSGPQSMVTLRTLATQAVINAENAMEILEHITAAANGDSYQDLRSDVEIVYGDGVYGTGHPDTMAETLGLTLVSSEYNPDSTGTDHIYDCDLGGTYLFHSWASAYGGGNGSFQDCLLSTLSSDEPLTGSYSRESTLIKYVYNPGWSFSTSYDEITRTQPDNRTRRLNGTLYDRRGALSFEAWRDLEYTAQAFEGQTVIEVAASRITSGAETGGPDALSWQRTFQSDFTIQSPATGNKSITVETTEAFSTPYANTCYIIGRLVATAVDGSTMTLVADNGNPMSFDLEVQSNDGDFSETLQWTKSTAFRVLTAGSTNDIELPALTSPNHVGDLVHPCGQ